MTETEVTRVACPGCRGLLRFEPEALDFPANCGGCECRFEVEIQVRVACPKCHSKSKIPDIARDYQIRCGRCQHEYLGHDGIPPGGGGRLLVARMLDTDDPNPPETIQPFVGHARERIERNALSPSAAELERIAEAERLKAEAIAERDRMVHETGLFKALLSRLVTTPDGNLSGDPGLAEALNSSLDLPANADPSKIRAGHGQGGPDTNGIASFRERADLATLRIAEERNRLEETIKELRGELEQARAEVLKHGGLVADQIAQAEREAQARHHAEKRVLQLRADLDRAQAEAKEHRNRLDSELPQAQKTAEEQRQLAEQKLLALQNELERARAESEEHRNRLASELPLAQKAADEAHDRLKQVEEKLAQVNLAHHEAERKASRLVIDHGKALYLAEQDRNALTITIERLTQAVISARTGEEEALDRLEEYANGLVAGDSAMANELSAERSRNADLGLVVESLNKEIEGLRQDQGTRAKVREDELAELQRRFDEDQRILVAEVERTRAHAEEVSKQLAKTKEQLESSNAQVQKWQASALEVETKYQSELSQIEDTSGKREETRLALMEENKKLTELSNHLLTENRRVEQLAEESAALRLENQHLAQGATIARQECQRLSEVLAANRLETQRLADSSGELQRLKLENEKLQSEYRRMAALAEKPGTPRQQNQKLADAIETAELLHLDNVRMGNILEVTKAEGDRRQKALVLEIQRIKQEYEKLVSSNERLVDRVQQLLDEKMAVAETGHATNGSKPATPGSTSPQPERRLELTAAESSN